MCSSFDDANLVPPGYYIAIALSGIVVALVSIYHKQIVDALTPTAQYLRKYVSPYLKSLGVR